MIDSQFGLPTEALARIRAVFTGYPQVEEVILYGSRAKGNYSAGSDIDLTLLGPNLNKTILIRIENELDDLLLPWTFDLSLFSRIDNKDLVDHIHRVGQVFFSRSE